MMTDDDAKILARLENKALHYLERYATTAQRLEQVLWRFAHRKLDKHDPDILTRLIRQQVDSCIERGYVNDATYANQKTASLRRQGASKNKIRQKLMDLGITKEQIDTALCLYDDEKSTDSETIAAIVHARKRRLGPFVNLERTKIGWQNRHLASFARAGFSIETARFVMAFENEEAANEWYHAQTTNN